MRKYLFMFMLVLALIFLPLMPVVKASDTPSIRYTAVTNTTNAHLVTQVAVTTIIPGKDRILGFSVAPNVSGSGTTIVGLYDADTAGEMATTTLFGEEGGVNTTTHSRVFPGPVSIADGVRVSQGDLTTVIIWYERTIN